MAGFLSNPQMTGSLLNALGAGLLTMGARPEDRGIVGAQAIGNFQNQMLDQRRQKERDLLLNLELSDRARANQEREDAKRRQQEQEQAYKNLLGGQASPNGLSQAQFGGAPQTTGPLANLNDAQRQFLLAAGPQAGFGVIGEQLFREAPGANSTIAKAGQDLMNGLIDKPTYDAIVRKETYIAPQKPDAQPADIQEYLYAKGQGFTGSFMDYQASQKGQGMSVTLPDGTVMQVGGAIKPPGEAQMQASNRAQLLKSGMDELVALYTNSDVGAWNMAGAETLEMLGPLGRVAGGKLRSGAEQKWSAAHSSALEGLAAAVTGAGVTNDQFARFTSMLPAPTDEPETKQYKLKAANDFLTVALSNAGAAGQAVIEAMKGGRPKAPIIGTIVDGYKFKGGNPADEKNWEKVQ